MSEDATIVVSAPPVEVCWMFMSGSTFVNASKDLTVSRSFSRLVSRRMPLCLRAHVRSPAPPLYDYPCDAARICRAVRTGTANPGLQHATDGMSMSEPSWCVREWQTKPSRQEATARVRC